MAVIKENKGDASAGTQTQYALSLDDEFQGALVADDNDWVKVELEAGTVYDFTLGGAKAVNLALYHDNEKTVSVNGFVCVPGAGLIYQPAVSGTYYLSIGVSRGADPGDYKITFAENTRPEGTYDEIADYLTDGFVQWLNPKKGRHTFTVVPGEALRVDISELAEGGRQLAQWALEAWTNVTGIRFEFVDDDTAQVTFDDDNEAGAGALATAHKGVIIVSHVNVPADFLESGPGVGGYAFETYIHEIGHALGLGHPGPYNGLGGYGLDTVFLNDSIQTSVMSYFSQEDNTYTDASHAHAVTPMIADIIAIQNLYGVPDTINLGDTVYGYRSNVDGYLGEFFRRWAGEDDALLKDPVTLTLYDNGGNDTLDLRTDRENQRIDLRPEGISDVYGLTGNLVIARETFIENAVAGSGDDVLSGNALANDLQGRAGADTLHGRGGDDILEGGAGADRLDGGGGEDWVSYRGSAAGVTVNLADETVTGGHAGGDVITSIENAIGSGHEDVLLGNGASNRLEGGGGADRLDGGGGEDWVSYRGSAAGVRVNLGDNTVAGGDAEGDRIANFENVTGSGFDDILTGDGGANRLDGGAGDDLLEGKAGADRLVGGSGDDTASYEHSGAAVTVRLHARMARGGDAEGDGFGSTATVGYTDRAGVARTESVPDIEHLRGSAYADTLAGDSRDNRLEGGPGADRLYGGPGGGDDALFGGAGADALFGGIGDDVLEGGAQADALEGGPGVDTVSYRHSPAAVVVRLSDGATRGGHAEGDVMADIENVTGSAYDDELGGDGGANVLEGGPGADRLDGGAGPDRVSYQGSDAGVVVRLSEGTGEGGDAEGDVISGVEQVTGSAYNDELVGDDGANQLAGGGGNDRLRGGRGDDLLEGGAGADRLDGGSGVDRASYRGSDAGVTVNLGEGAATGGHAHGDEFTGIEDVAGSVYRDLLVGDDGDNHLDGAGADDELRGAGGRDLLTGGLGEDRLFGGGGADELRGGEGNDRLFGEAGDDSLYGEAGDDALHGGEGGDRLFGGRGGDALHGDGGDDALHGGEGSDRLSGGAGADRLDGGGGIDWLSYLGSAAGVTADLALGTGAGGDARGDEIAGIENLAGSGHDDVLRGDESANVLQGLDGADELYGNAGDDVLEGGAGADRLDGGAGVDTLDYRASGASVTVFLQTGFERAEGGHAQGDSFTGIENVTGSDYRDYLVGDNGANRLAGGNDNDTLNGLGGADYLDGGPGTDRIQYTESGAGVRVDLEQGSGAGGHAQGDVMTGIENIDGSRHDDVLIGNSASNRLTGSGGDDELYGGAGDDVLTGGSGADRLDGGEGNDEISFYHSDAGVTVNLAEASLEGGEADGDVIVDIEGVRGSNYSDVLTGDQHDNTLSGWGGDDNIHGGDGDDRINGNAGDDHLHGNGGDDFIEAGAGHDYLHGGGGKDWISGGAGADRLNGGAGEDILGGYRNLPNEKDGEIDVFIFDAEHEAGETDIIYFADGEDKIDLSAFDLPGFDDVTLSFDYGQTVIDLAPQGGGRILLFEFDGALDATDFLL